MPHIADDAERQQDLIPVCSSGASQLTALGAPFSMNTYTDYKRRISRLEIARGSFSSARLTDEQLSDIVDEYLANTDIACITDPRERAVMEEYVASREWAERMKEQGKWR